MWATLLAFFGDVITKIVLGLLQTPAKETTIEYMPSSIDPIATPANDLLNQYQWMRNRV